MQKSLAYPSRKKGCGQILLVTVPGEETSTEWCEAVDENEYSKL